MSVNLPVFKLLPIVALACAACGEATDGTADGGTDGGTSTVFINEVVAANATGCADEASEKDDWIELHNTGAAEVSLEGWSITDDREVPLKKVFAKGVTVPAHGFLVLWADDTPSQGDAHLPFKLAAKGEEVVLYGPTQVIVDQFAWSNALDDVANARFPDGTGAFAVCAKSTCGVTNGAACAQ